MKTNVPKIDGRSAVEIYDQALALARQYFPQTSAGITDQLPSWPNIHRSSAEFDESDVGVVLLRLFSRLAETVVRQTDRAPEKHQLAFFDFMGVEQLPPVASRAPLTFLLAKGTRMPVAVPARTKVAAKDNPTVVFETVEAFTALNMQIAAACSINPWTDTFSDHSGKTDGSGSDEGLSIFAGNQPVEHALHISDDAFDAGTFASLKIAFSFVNAAAMKDQFQFFFGNCSDAAGKALSSQPVTVDAESYSFEFVDAAMEKTAAGKAIVFRPKGALTAAVASSLPEIDSIRCDVKVEGLSPDAVFFNDNSIEIKKGFYPFGQTSKAGDAFYIACDTAFSKSDSVISINFSMNPGIASDGFAIAWEYWDGAAWIEATGTAKGSEVFTMSGTATMTLVIPSDRPAVATDLNGTTSRWIRGRIDDGNFGGPGGFESSNSSATLAAIDDILKRNEVPDKVISAVNTGLTASNILVGVTFQEPSYQPPFVNSMSIGYHYTNKPVQHCKTVNNFKSEEHVRGKLFKPFTVIEEETPSLYLMFSGVNAGSSCSLYFSLKGAEYGDPTVRLGVLDYLQYDAEDEAKAFRWSFYSDKAKAWLDLGVDDGTVNFSRSGIVTFIVPPTMGTLSLFGQSGRWVRVSSLPGKWLQPPVIKAILPNTVWGENASAAKDEIVGSSNGMPGQIFSLAARPVLAGQVIEVKEPAVPSEDELRLVRAEEGDSAVSIIRADSGDIKEVWVRWHEVTSFAGSAAISRHYVIDRTGGRIIFGDGVRGMIPPAVSNNIVARFYKSGGGKNGDVKHGTLTGMKTTIPNIERVFNQDDASGGRGMEDTDSLVRRTPYALRTGDRAVTAGDFEMLAMESSPYVAKAACVTDEESGEVRVIIAPAYAGDRPSPEAALLDHVASYLKERAYSPVRDRIRVVGPEYETMKIAVEFRPVTKNLGTLAAEKVKEKLQSFFNAITGGRDGGGWPFGSEIFHSEVASVVEDVEGVDYIARLIVNGSVIGAAGTPWVTRIAGNALPWAGDGDITVTPVSGGDE